MEEEFIGDESLDRSTSKLWLIFISSITLVSCILLYQKFPCVPYKEIPNICCLKLYFVLCLWKSPHNKQVVSIYKGPVILSLWLLIFFKRPFLCRVCSFLMLCINSLHFHFSVSESEWLIKDLEVLFGFFFWLFCLPLFFHKIMQHFHNATFSWFVGASRPFVSSRKMILLICDLPIIINVTDDILRWHKYLKWKEAIRWCQPNRNIYCSVPGCFQNGLSHECFFFFPI